MYIVCFMSPVIFRADSLKYVIYPKDHQPAHVHVIGPGAEAKFEIRTLKLIKNYGFSERTLKKITSYLKVRQNSLLEAWHDYQD